MQDPSTINLQIPSINQKPNSTRYPPPTRYLPTAFCNFLTCFIQNPSQIFELWCIPSTRISYFNHSSLLNTITLLLFAFIFRYLLPFRSLLHTWTKCPTFTFRCSSDSPYKTKSSACKRPGNLHSLPSSRNLTSILLIPIFTSFITVSIYTLKSQGDTTLCHTTINPETVASPLFLYSGTSLQSSATTSF